MEPPDSVVLLPAATFRSWFVVRVVRGHSCIVTIDDILIEATATSPTFMIAQSGHDSRSYNDILLASFTSLYPSCVCCDPTVTVAEMLIHCRLHYLAVVNGQSVVKKLGKFLKQPLLLCPFLLDPLFCRLYNALLNDRRIDS